jgi:hypothetical protein
MLAPAVRLILANPYHLVTHTGQFECCTLRGSEHWMRNCGQPEQCPLSADVDGCVLLPPMTPSPWDA